VKLRLSRDAREALIFIGGMAGITYMMVLGPIHPELIPVFAGMILYKPAAVVDRKTRPVRRSSTSPDTESFDPSDPAIEPEDA